MAINKKVSIKLALLRALDEMDMNDDSKRPIFTDWAIEGERKIGSFYQYQRKVVALKIYDKRYAELPCETVAVLGVVGCSCMPDTHQCETIFGKYAQHYASRTAHASSFDDFYSTAYTMGIPGVDVSYQMGRYEIQDNNIVFLTPQSSEYIVVSILAYQIDNEGFPKVNENHIVAIAEYIVWRRMRQLRFKPGVNQFSRADIAEQEMQWHRQCGDARATSDPCTETDMADIVNMYNNPLSGMQQAVWKYADEFYTPS